MKTIVISAVNIRKGGTLTILRGCLRYLSELSAEKNFRVVALVHDKKLSFYENIEYIEFPNTIKSWAKRLWCEYVEMKRISKQLSPVYLWLSLHDTTPNVIAERRAVYCQTSFPFLKWKFLDLKYDYKIVLFSLFTRFAYLINVSKNNHLIVQTNWLRDGLSKILSFPQNKIIVSPPMQDVDKHIFVRKGNADMKTFLFASTPDCHKNFELLCAASEMLEKEIGEGKFSVTITIKGNENKYAKWLYKKWGHVKSINFAGFMNRDTLFEWYNKADCLVFPSRVETWGLPISEFSVTKKPMLLSNLPYAHETASGSEQVAFFNSENATDLKEKMKKLIQRDLSDFKKVEEIELDNPVANSWEELFEILLR